jgi:hypothetical protein
VLAKRFQREVHRLVESFAGAHQGAERREAQVAIKLGLPRRARDHGEVVLLLQRVPREQVNQAAEDEPTTAVACRCQQPHLDRPPGGKVLIEVRQFQVERERSLSSHGQHADQSFTADRDDICVLVVESIDEGPCRIRWVLRDLFHERLVVEPMDLLKLPVCGGNPEAQRLVVGRPHGEPLGKGSRGAAGDRSGCHSRLRFGRIQARCQPESAARSRVCFGVREGTGR